MFGAGLTVGVGLLAADGFSTADSQWLPLFAVWTAAYAGSFALIPWAVAVVFAEAFRLRSPWLWLAVGGGTGAAGFLLNEYTPGTPWAGFDLAFHLAAGFVAGIAYWLVAGRNAGMDRGPASGRQG